MIGFGVFNRGAQSIDVGGEQRVAFALQQIDGKE